MRRRRALKALLCGAAVCATGGLLAGCQTGFRRAFNFKLTVEVMTPQGLRTGSSVYEIWAVPMFDPTLPNKGHYASNLIGQAAIIDLPDGPVFALATGEKGIQDSVITALNGNVPPNSDDYVDIIGRLGHASVKAELPRSITLPNGETWNRWPLMIRFKDINDPKSMEAVDPEVVSRGVV